MGVAEIVNGQLAARGATPLGTSVDAILEYEGDEGRGIDETRCDTRLVKVDMSESRTIPDKYGVKTTPFVLFFYGGRTVYGGTLGGTAMKMRNRQEKVLLIEPNFNDQIKTEGVLTRQRQSGRLSWDLVMSGTEAVVRNSSKIASESEGYDVVLLSESCSEEDAAIVDRVFRGGQTLIVGMASLHTGSVTDKYIHLTHTFLF